MCIYIDSTTFADRIYNLVLESESEQHEAHVKLTTVAEDPNQHSEEAPTSFTQEGKTRCMIPVFKLCNVVPFYLCI
jgi:hypothetical protein